MLLLRRLVEPNRQAMILFQLHLHHMHCRIRLYALNLQSQDTVAVGVAD